MTAAALIVDACNSHGVSVNRLLSDSKWRSVVDVRQCIAIKMQAAGMSTSEIGRALHRDHSTIVHLLNRRPRADMREVNTSPQALASRERAYAKLMAGPWIEDAHRPRRAASLVCRRTFARRTTFNVGELIELAAKNSTDELKK